MNEEEELPSGSDSPIDYFSRPSVMTMKKMNSVMQAAATTTTTTSM
jgi:hypothetical protein